MDLDINTKYNPFNGIYSLVTRINRENFLKKMSYLVKIIVHA